ncbi:MAG TPA: sulfite exporter TauE/SafE family protein [Acidimicrobiales bacterium]|nr:sulfite exporter TauE/SafE family protein [Acidimicrobiales bacterium]
MDIGPLRDAVTVVIGLATGLLSGVFGVGGGVISQPGMRLLGLEPLAVIGTALPVIVPGAASGAWRYAREDLIRWPAVAATVPAGALAAVVGSVAADHVPGEGHLLQLLTAALLGLSAYRMGTAPGPATAVAAAGEPLAETDAPEAPDAALTPTVPPLADEGIPVPRCIGIGVVAGLLSGLLGIGGGVIMVPAFIALAQLEVKPAIATSLVCVGAFAVPGTITHALQGQVDWRVVGALVVGVVPGARLGAAVAIRAADRRLRVVVGSFLGVTALLYALGEIRSLVS